MKTKMQTPHPGEVLQDQLKALGLSGNALSIALGVPSSRINDILLQRRGITADSALRLARYFRTSAEYWLDLQQAYDLFVAEREAGKVIRSIKPRQQQAA
jgi:antitoxin HigA-1